LRRIAHPSRVDVDRTLWGDQGVLPKAAGLDLPGGSANVSWIEIEPIADVHTVGIYRRTIGTGAQQYLTAYPAEPDPAYRMQGLFVACVDLGGRKQRTLALNNGECVKIRWLDWRQQIVAGCSKKRLIEGAASQHRVIASRHVERFRTSWT